MNTHTLNASSRCKLFLACSSILLIGCGQHSKTVTGKEVFDNNSSVSTAKHVQTNVAGRATSEWTSEQWKQYQREKDAALARAAKLREQAPQDEVTLPNYDAGPGRPNPLARNFYETNKKYSAYLLCTYSVFERHYDESNEAEWFKEALLQVRCFGRNRFPPIRWITVAIFNRADFQGAGTFDVCFKAGTIVDADQVFNLEMSLSNVVANASIERHPIKYDPQQLTPGEQQRWTLVERHVVTNDGKR